MTSLHTQEEQSMPKVSLDTPAPDFALQDPQGQKVRLSDYHGEKNILLVFNRGFF